jgi:hypothetical protein
MGEVELKFDGLALGALVVDRVTGDTKLIEECGQAEESFASSPHILVARRGISHCLQYPSLLFSGKYCLSLKPFLLRSRLGEVHTKATVISVDPLEGRSAHVDTLRLVPEVVLFYLFMHSQGFFLGTPTPLGIWVGGGPSGLFDLH